jgi:hypothetical protein
MKDTPTRREPSDDNSSDPLAPTDSSVITPDSEATDEGASPSSPSAAPVEADTPAPRMTVEKWAASQPYRPLPRVPRTVLAHLYKDCLGRPPSRILEPQRKHVRLNWVQIFLEADERFRKAAAEKARKTEGS